MRMCVFVCVQTFKIFATHHHTSWPWGRECVLVCLYRLRALSCEIWAEWHHECYVSPSLNQKWQILLKNYWCKKNRVHVCVFVLWRRKAFIGSHLNTKTKIPNSRAKCFVMLSVTVRESPSAPAIRLCEGFYKCDGLGEVNLCHHHGLICTGIVNSKTMN